MTTANGQHGEAATVAGMVVAFGHSRQEHLAALCAGVARDSTLHRAGSALLAYLHAHRSGTIAELDPAIIDQALMSPGLPADLEACLLPVFYWRHMPTLALDRQQQLVRRIRELLPMVDHLRARASLYRLWVWIELELHANYRSARRIAADAIAELAADVDLWLEFRYKHFQAAALDHAFVAIEEEVASLAHLAADLQRIGADWTNDHLNYLLHSGRAEQALSILDGMTPPLPVTTAVHGALLIATGRLDQAAALQDDWAGHQAGHLADDDDATSRALLTIELAVAQRACERAHEAIATLGPALGARKDLHDQLLVLTAQRELCGARAPAARVVLERLDPHGKRGDLHCEWGRLALLEGDEATAAHQLDIARRRGGQEYLEYRLRYAWELTGGNLLRLLRLPLTPQTAPVTTRHSASVPTLIGTDPAIDQIRRLIQVYAPLPQSVLIEGEAGTGKRLVARLLARHANKQAPFEIFDGAVLSQALAATELFGRTTADGTVHPGALARTRGGTLCLGHVDHLPPRLQDALAAMLAAGHYRPVDGLDRCPLATRLVATVDGALHDRVAAGAFRADLYYRLAHLTLELPPLRARRDDCAPLATHLLHRATGDPQATCTPALLAELATEPWPGNVAQLADTIDSMVLYGRGQRVFDVGDRPALHAYPGSTA